MVVLLHCETLYRTTQLDSRGMSCRSLHHTQFSLYTATSPIKPGSPVDCKHFSQATVSVKISNFLIYFCRFALSCPILEKKCFFQSCTF